MMIGQEEIINKLDLQGPYIILGSRGVGKTSLAKEIIKKSICDHGTGCGECKPCKTFESGNYIDFHYIQGGKSDRSHVVL